jgi:hypothetical protein
MKTKLFLCATIAALLTLLMASSAFATTVPTFTLSSSSSQIQYSLPAGTSFNGSILTTGPIRFFVSAPNGTVIVNLSLIDKNAAFSFVAQQNGTYTLYFENDLPSSVQVSFSYVTNPNISGSNNSTGISTVYLPIFIVIVVVGAIVVFFVIRRKTKNQTSVQSNSAFESSA